MIVDAFDAVLELAAFFAAFGIVASVAAIVEFFFFRGDK